MSRTFYLRHGNEVSGPVTTRQLREMAANGTLRKSDHVRPGNQDKWYVAGVVKGLFADTAQSSEPKRAQTPTPRSRSARPLASPTEGMIDIGGFERDRKRRVAAHRRRTVLLAIAGGFIVIIVVVAVLSGRGLSDDLAGKEGASSASPRTAENVERAGAADTRRFKRPEDSGSPLAEVDFTFTQWQDVLSTCHPDPDYILTDDDVYRAMGIYEFGKQAPTFAANRQRMFNIVAGCYYWNRDKPLKEWKYMLIQKWDPYWDESPHCEIAEDSRKRETERRAKNAKYVRKSTKTPPTQARLRDRKYGISAKIQQHRLISNSRSP